MSQEVLVEPERRRRWSDAEKISILIEAAAPEVTVTEAARRHGISRQHIYHWRSEMRKGRLADETGGPFLAVEYVAPEWPPVEGAANIEGAAPMIELSLRRGRVLRAPVSIAPSVLTALIRAAEAA